MVALLAAKTVITVAGVAFVRTVWPPTGEDLFVGVDQEGGGNEDYAYEKPPSQYVPQEFPEQLMI